MGLGPDEELGSLLCLTGVQHRLIQGVRQFRGDEHVESRRLSLGIALIRAGNWLKADRRLSRGGLNRLDPDGGFRHLRALDYLPQNRNRRLSHLERDTPLLLLPTSAHIDPTVRAKIGQRSLFELIGRGVDEGAGADAQVCDGDPRCEVP